MSNKSTPKNKPNKNVVKTNENPENIEQNEISDNGKVKILFELEQVNSTTFEGRKYVFKNGEVQSMELIGRDLIGILKHKLHRDMYQSSIALYAENKLGETAKADEINENIGETQNDSHDTATN